MTLTTNNGVSGSSFLFIGVDANALEAYFLFFCFLFWNFALGVEVFGTFGLFGVVFPAAACCCINHVFVNSLCCLFIFINRFIVACWFNILF